MMRMNNIKMVTVVPRESLLAKLRENAAEHKQIVEEARKGYVEQARKALEHRLERLAKGEIVSLQFSLSAPQDYSEVYRTTIEMLEWTKEDQITLQADEFRQLVQDQWDWSDSFYLGNSTYSPTAAAKMK